MSLTASSPHRLPSSLVRLLTLAPDADSALRGEVGPRRLVAWLSGLQLNEVTRGGREPAGGLFLEQGGRGDDQRSRPA